MAKRTDAPTEKNHDSKTYTETVAGHECTFTESYYKNDYTSSHDTIECLFSDQAGDITVQRRLRMQRGSNTVYIYDNRGTASITNDPQNSSFGLNVTSGLLFLSSGESIALVPEIPSMLKTAVQIAYFIAQHKATKPFTPA